MELKVELLPLDKVQPNPWNPNKQSDRQFEAEVESICSNGFVMPILVRKEGKGWQIIDGEHRKHALDLIVNQNLEGVGNVPDLVASKLIPALVLDVDEKYAKRLTIIMNETRGRADLASLGLLLSELSSEFGQDLITGLPYTPSQLDEMMEIAKFDWSELDLPAGDDDLTNDTEERFKVTALLDIETEQAWKSALAARKDALPSDPKEAAGALITHLLNKENTR